MAGSVERSRAADQADSASAGAASRGAGGACAAVPPRVALVRLGCRVNQADAEAVLEACGAVPPAAGVDAVLVSTCVVTADAEATAFQAVRRAAREYPGAPIVICGCAGSLKAAELSALDGVAAVVGPGDVEAAANAVAAAARRARAAAEREEPGDGRTGLPAGPGIGGAGAGAPAWRRRARPTLKIQDGCDRRCAYCVVPLARGRSRSLEPEVVLERVRAAGDAADEVILAGVHLGAYGHDLGPGAPTLEDLVQTIAARRLVHRVRLSSIDPLEVPRGALAGPVAEILCAQFHLPLQSGSDRILAAMGRPYSSAEAARVVEGVARAMPDAWVTADVMAGFPGETEADHRATVAFVEALPLAALHVFTFSPRSGTAAAAMPGRVPAALAAARAAELREASDRAWRRRVEGLVGRRVEAIAERVGGGEAQGTTREGVLARWRLSPGAPEPRRGGAVLLRAVAREGDAIRCEPLVPGE